jgi:hypothetical protein
LSLFGKETILYAPAATGFRNLYFPADLRIQPEPFQKFRRVLCRRFFVFDQPFVTVTKTHELVEVFRFYSYIRVSCFADKAKDNLTIGGEDAHRAIQVFFYRLDQ